MKLEYKWQATIIVALGLFMAVLDNTVVNVALPNIKTFYHSANYSDVVWVSTAYFLAQAAVIPAVGYVSDIIGTKRVFLIALAIFTLGSALCAVAPSLPALLIFRVFQGIGGGALFPIVFAIIFRIFPPNERGIASAVVGVPVLLAPAFGPTIGGYLTTTFDWHAIFTVNLPIGIVVFILGLLLLRNLQTERAAFGPGAGLPVPTERTFDFLGLGLVMAGITTLVYGISQAGTDGLGNSTVLLFMGIGVVLLGAFAWVELSFAADPVLDLRQFQNYSFSMGNVLTGIVGAFFFGGVLLFPIFFQNVLNYSPLSSGEVFILQGLSAAVGVFVAGRLYNRVGPRPLAATGLGLVAFASIVFTHMDLHTTGWSIQGWMVIRGFGFGMTNTPLQTFTLSSVNNRSMARASSLMNALRQIFSAIGVASITAFLAQQTTVHATPLAASAKQALTSHHPTGFVATCIAQVGKQGQTAVHDCVQNYIGTHALLGGLNDAFTLVMVFFFIGAVVALFMGRDANVQKLQENQRQGITTTEVRPMAIAE